MVTGGGSAESRIGGDRGQPRRRSGPLLALAGVVLVGAVAGAALLSAGGDDEDGDTPPTVSTTGSTGTSAPATTAPAEPAEGRALGTVEVAGAATECALEECLEVRVECPGIPSAPAIVAIQPAAGEPAGTVVLFSGARGSTFWANPEQRRQVQVLDALAAAGLEVVEVAWPGDGWGAAPAGEAVGFASLACRAATVTRWIHDERYAPLGLEPELGGCGFCVSGNSGGASQIAYSLAYYGLDGIIDAAVLTSGPPHADVLRGCRGAPGDEPYAYGRASLPYIDGAYGHANDPGPCAMADADLEQLWAQDSLASGGTDYRHETTRIEVILGGRDRTVAPAHARLYVAALEAAGTPLLRVQEIDDMEHEVLAEQVSRDAVVAAILGTE